MNSYYGNNGFQNGRPNQFSSYINSNGNGGIPPVASANNIIWVQGIEGAKAYQLAPNSMVILLDSEVEGKMYIKVSDNIGMSSLRIFNYVEEIPSSTNNTVAEVDIDLSQYVKKDELTELIKEIMKNEQSVSTVGGNGASTTASATTATKPKVIIQQSKQQ